MAAVTLLLTTAAAAQEPPSFRGESRLVGITVFVTDEDGRPVTDLGPDDFSVREDGKPVDVAAFRSVGPQAPPPGEVEGGAPAIDPALLPRQFLFVFDLAFTPPQGILRAREAVATTLRDGLAPEDLAAIATLTPQGASLVVGFTTDRVQALAALDSFGLRREERLRDLLEITYDLGLPDPRLQKPAEDPGRFKGLGEALDIIAKLMLRADRTQYARTVETWIGGLEALGRWIAPLRGHKEIVLLSAGFDDGILAGEPQEARMYGLDADPTTAYGDPRLRDRLNELARTWAVADGVLHTVDVRGLETGSDASTAMPQRVGVGRESLVQLASQGGGRAQLSVVDGAAAVASLVEDARSYYVLGVVPRPDRGDRFRKLDVDVRGRTLRVRHRAGYRLDGSQPVPDRGWRSLAAEAIAKGLDQGDLGLAAVAVVREPEGERAQAHAVLSVDAARLLEGAPDGPLELEVVAYSFGREGRILDAVHARPRLDVDQVADRLRAGGLRIVTVLAAEAGVTDLRFAVAVPATGRFASLRYAPESEGGESPMQLSAPLWMEDPFASLVVPLVSRHPDWEIAFRAGDRPFLPSTAPVLARGETRELCLLLWGAAPGPLQVEASLLPEGTGSLALAGPVARLADRDGIERLLFDVVTGDVAPGTYRLQVRVAGSDGSVATSSADVDVR